LKLFWHGDGHIKRGYHSILGFTGHNFDGLSFAGNFFISSSIPSHDNHNAIQDAHIIMKAAKTSVKSRRKIMMRAKGVFWDGLENRERSTTFAWQPKRRSIRCQ
jgi:hypothetical protein